MTIGEIKQATVELKKFCSNREKCYGCPFRIRTAFAFERCSFNPFEYVGAFPREWRMEKNENADD